jgi:hypothetical protein
MPVSSGSGACWALFARRLMKKRYGIEAKDLERLDEQEDWNVLFEVLGALTTTDMRGSLTLIVFEATGWCGVAAIWFEPALRNRYYVPFSILLIVAGLLHDWWVAGNLNNPRFLGLLKIRALMREYPYTAYQRDQHRADSAPESDEA